MHDTHLFIGWIREEPCHAPILSTFPAAGACRGNDVPLPDPSAECMYHQHARSSVAATSLALLEDGCLSYV